MFLVRDLIQVKVANVRVPHGNIQCHQPEFFHRREDKRFYCQCLLMLDKVWSVELEVSTAELLHKTLGFTGPFGLVFETYIIR